MEKSKLQETANLITDVGFYHAFEEKYRGSREVIKFKLGVYFPYIKLLKTIYNDCKAVDLGCGRGEWLELLEEIGVNAVGVDLDEGMLEDCRVRNLVAEQGDGIEYLKALPDASVAIITGFHIVEHIDFSDLQVLVKEALRVLKPSGLLILETPNPENLMVGTCSFYTDPTHIKPLPPALLSFLPEYYGFQVVKTLRLHEPSHLENTKGVRLIDVLGHVSPDYAIIAIKESSTEQDMALFSEILEVNHGNSLHDLAEQYHEQIQQKLDQLTDIYQSKSWRFTAPLRFSFEIGQRTAAKIKGVYRQICSFFLRGLSIIIQRGLKYSQSHPRILSVILGCFNRFPNLRGRISNLAGIESTVAPENHTRFANNLTLLSPLGRQIYIDLQTQIKREQGEEI